MNTLRAKTKVTVKRKPPTHVATAQNQVWTWDITWLNALIKGQYYKLYLIIDMFSRLIVAYEVWETEKAEYAETLVDIVKPIVSTYSNIKIGIYKSSLSY